MLSTQKLDQKTLALIYNMADCTVNISDAEGFGLSTLESLACGTPIIVNMTGGLQEQVTDGKSWFGIGIEPTSKAIIGSQDIPMIYEDRVSEEAVVKALTKMFNKTKKQRTAMGKRGRKHVLKNYNFDETMKVWDELIQEVIEVHGSWETRKNYKSWRFERIKIAA
jgi:glycosyltransferase involved in cell wall biosynthesis